MDEVSGRSTRPLVDPFGRTVRDLRVSVTDRCNFRCTYCMPEEGMQWLDRSELLTFEEIERVARVCVERFDFDGIRLTGGEPTVRAQLPVLVDMLAAGNRAILKPSDYTPACSSLIKGMIAATFGCLSKLSACWRAANASANIPFCS